MESELDVIDSLSALGYTGKCLQNDVLTASFSTGIRNADFRELVLWLTGELHVLRKTDEKVSAGVDDVSEFAMELSAMLKELGCPYKQFVAGPLSERFESQQALLLLLDYLLAELMAIKMSIHLHPTEQTYVIPKTETNTARAMEQLTRDLNLGKPPENVTPKALFDKLNFKVEERLRQVHPAVVSEPLLKTPRPLSDAQWQQLEAIHKDLDAEYNLRRQVLLTRLEVTVQSFQWSEKMKCRENEMISKFQQKMNDLDRLKYGGDETNIVALLAARKDLAIIEKTSSANVRKNTASKIQKHVIGSVPDRGGRAHEHAPPPPEMPSWQQQRATGPAGGGGTGYRGGGGGNRGGNFRGGRDGGAGGGRGGGAGGHWQSYSAGQAEQQHQPQYEQSVQFEHGRDQNWISGSGRVQGTGWNPQGNRDQDRVDRSDGYNNNNSNQTYRGRSNYKRGGGGHRR